MRKIIKFDQKVYIFLLVPGSRLVIDHLNVYSNITVFCQMHSAEKVCRQQSIHTLDSRVITIKKPQSTIQLKNYKKTLNKTPPNLTRLHTALICIYQADFPGTWRFSKGTKTKCFQAISVNNYIASTARKLDFSH